MAAVSSGIQINRVNHVVYLVKDTKRSMDFYNGFLGIKQIPSQVDNPKITWLQMPSGIMLHLIEMFCKLVVIITLLNFPEKNLFVLIEIFLVKFGLLKTIHLIRYVEI